MFDRPVPDTMVTKKKSASQIRRQIKRAQSRGETYTVKESSSMKDGDLTLDGDKDTIDLKQPKKSKSIVKDSNSIMIQAFEKMNQSLEHIAQDSNLDARSRRSAKRKAEAIAAQESGCAVSELSQWYENYVKEKAESTSSKKEAKKNPYILFIGQLSYQTTAESIRRHIQSSLGSNVNNDTLKIRLMNQDGKSKGMAFAEFTDPELMYQALSLHHTQLDGRRINIERSVGGRKNSQVRKEKLKLRRKEQDDYITQTVDKILQEYREQGQLEEDELDDGVKALCYRRSPAIVEAALKEYVDARGTTLENPSAYLSRIICRITEEGPDSTREKDNTQKKMKKTSIKRPFQATS